MAIKRVWKLGKGDTVHRLLYVFAVRSPLNSEVKLMWLMASILNKGGDESACFILCKEEVFVTKPYNHLLELIYARVRLMDD